MVQIALEAVGASLRHKTVALFSDSSTTVSVLQKLYTRSTSLRSTLGRILSLLRRYDLALDVHHIRGELNSIADRLSRTVELNHYRLDPAALLQAPLHIDFDLYGSSLHALAPRFPATLHYRRR